MAGKIIRVTMFKMPRENHAKFAELYKTLSATARKACLQPTYILSFLCAPIEPQYATHPLILLARLLGRQTIHPLARSRAGL